MKPLLEDVFKISGQPTYTFVTPGEFDRLRIALRTPGRGVVVEGASGIGKTSAVIRLLGELKVSGDEFQYWSTRNPVQLLNIRNLSASRNFGKIVIDDFHRLDDALKAQISDIMKLLADTEDRERKIVIIGINEAGKSIVNFSRDLNERIEYVKLKRAQDDVIRLMIQNGESALNISIRDKEMIVKDSFGCLHIAQMLCREACMVSAVYEHSHSLKEINPNYHMVKEKVLTDLGRKFDILAKMFASGPNNKRDGRAPYLHVLKLLASSEDWMINIRDLSMTTRSHSGSLRNMISSRNGINKLFRSHPELREVLYYSDISKEISAEDSKFMFYVSNIPWNKFASELGFSAIEFKSRYDVALSFSGQDRGLAQKIFDQLTRRELEVFYDYNEQDRIIGQSVEEYLMPIYRSEAAIVLPLISKDYPERLWTQLETKAFRNRFSQGEVVPVRIDNFNDVFLQEAAEIGGLSINTSGNVDNQIKEIVEIICRRVRANQSGKNSEIASD